jgi:hypothetical protein
VIKEKVDRDVVKIACIKTCRMLADILTTPMSESSTNWYGHS